MARCLFSTLRLRVLFSQEIVPHFVYLLNPFLSVFPCKKAKSCFSKSFCRLARRWPRFPFARIPIFNALCLFFVLVPYSHFLEVPVARERTVWYDRYPTQCFFTFWQTYFCHPQKCFACGGRRKTPLKNFACGGLL